MLSANSAFQSTTSTPRTRVIPTTECQQEEMDVDVVIALFTTILAVNHPPSYSLSSNMNTMEFFSIMLGQEHFEIVVDACPWEDGAPLVDFMYYYSDTGAYNINWGALYDAIQMADLSGDDDCRKPFLECLIFENESTLLCRWLLWQKKNKVFHNLRVVFQASASLHFHPQLSRVRSRSNRCVLTITIAHHSLRRIPFPRCVSMKTSATAVDSAYPGAY